MTFGAPRLWQLAAIFWLCPAVSSTQPAAEEDLCASQKVITRDVCILGGGSTGTYAAIQLRDRGNSVVVVEQSSRLGGHAETRYFPDGGFINYGVEGVFGDEPSRRYMERLGVEYEPLLPASFNTDYLDFKSGQKTRSDPSLTRSLSSLLDYRQAIGKYSFLDQGIYNLPDPVPEELLRPFGDFVRENGVEEALPVIFTFASAAGLMLESPLLEVLQLFGVPHVDAVLSGYITPVRGMYELYRRAADALGPDSILYRTTAEKVTRSESDGVTVVVQSSGKGGRKCIRARKLLVTIPPTMENMEPLDLEAPERKLFEKWQWKNYYVAVVNNTGIPDRLNVANVDPSQPYTLPVPPFQWQLEFMGVPGYVTSKLIAESSFSPRDARDLILADIGRMSGVYPIQDPDIVNFANHAPSVMRPSSEHIRNGFYRRLYALQGRRNTYYTGRAFCSDYSSLLWAYTDEVVDQMRQHGGGHGRGS